MHIPSLIEKKRDGGALSPAELKGIIDGFTAGAIPDYQLSAFAMAVFFQGMTPEETAALTRAMLESGDTFSYPDGSPPKVDKHSTGGIGDKVSLVLAPLLACDHLWIPMISGRGLGITGGTLDKLECIPGFNVNLTQDRALKQLESIGVVMMGQTDSICPADRKFYSLRDVTGTVPSQPLIVASIMSKKLAESLDALVLDVKFGSGAFMKTREQAESLATALTDVGEQFHVRTQALLTPMDQPLGRSVGNALEVGEAIDTLHGAGPPDLINLTLDLASRVARAPRDQLAAWLEDGSAWNKFVALVEAQDGDPAALENFAALHPAPVVREITAPAGGKITSADAETIGRASLLLGAGRATAFDSIDPSVGFDRIRKVGDSISKGDSLARVHARTNADADSAAQSILQAFTIT